MAEQFYMAGDTDFTAKLTAIAEAAPDVVFGTGFIPELPLMVRQAREEIGITATFLGGDSWDNPGLIREPVRQLTGVSLVVRFR